MPGFERFGEAEKKGVQQVLDNGVLMRYGFDAMRNGHWKACEMEAALAARMQAGHAHLVSSGTAALTVALASAGIGAGDEVIMPTFTFVASFEAVLSVGAVPVLCDIDDTLTLAPAAVEALIGPNTRAIMPVHMCGSMADLNALVALAESHGLVLIEDACQAIGGTYQGKPLGSIGHIGCFSFDYVKTITCGEGGGLITNDAAIYDRAQAYSDHGHDHVGPDRGAEGHDLLGYNYRISELHAAVGLVQLGRLDEFLGVQKAHYTVFRNALEQVPGVTMRRVPEGGEENYSFLSFFMPDAQQAVRAHRALSEAGLDGVFYWFDNNWHYHRRWDHLKEAKSPGPMPGPLQESVNRRNNRTFEASDRWMGRTLSILIKLSWSQAELERRAAILRTVLSGL